MLQTEYACFYKMSIAFLLHGDPDLLHDRVALQIHSLDRDDRGPLLHGSEPACLRDPDDLLAGAFICDLACRARRQELYGKLPGLSLLQLVGRFHIIDLRGVGPCDQDRYLDRLSSGSDLDGALARGFRFDLSL